MAKFMLLFQGKEFDPTDESEETTEYAQKWGEWMAKLTMEGFMESGAPLEWSGKVIEKDAIRDYQLREVDDGGYMILNASSMEEAANIAKGAPNVDLGGQVVIRPIIEIPGE